MVIINILFDKLFSNGVCKKVAAGRFDVILDIKMSN